MGSFLEFLCNYSEALRQCRHQAYKSKSVKLSVFVNSDYIDFILFQHEVVVLNIFV